MKPRARTALAVSAALVLASACFYGGEVPYRGALPATLILLLAAALAAAAREAVPLLRACSRGRFLALTAATALAPRAAWIALSPNAQHADFGVYDELARSLVSGLGYAFNGFASSRDMVDYLGHENPVMPYTTSYRPPGTPFIAAALYWALGTEPLWMKLLNAALGAGTALLIHRLLSESGHESAGRLAALAWAVYPSAVFATNLLCSEIPFTAALLGVAYLSSRKGAPAAAAAGLLGAFACLIRPMWPPLLAAAAWTWWQGGPSRSALRKSALFLAFFALGLAPWAARNTRLWGRLTVICTDGGMVLANHTSRLLPEAAARTPERLERLRRWRAMRNEAEQSAEGLSIAAENAALLLRAGPMSVLGWVSHGFSSTFGSDDEMLHWSTLAAGNRRVLPRRVVFGLGRINTAFYLAAWALAVWGLLRQRLPWSALSDGCRFLLVNFLLTWLFFLFIPGQDRYHFSLMPIVLMLAGGALAAGRDA